MAKKQKVGWAKPTKKDADWPPPAVFAKSLLRWFDAHARDLPWRRTRDLYAIWISEIMLQQTQVATVIPYWERFLDRFPSVEQLAAADESEVLKLWEGLGYYRRARQLHAAARKVVESHACHFPATLEHVRGLPGIGRYTAGAILSIGLDQRLPILEANTIRVLSRLNAYRGDVKSSAGQKHLWALAESLLPADRCGAFNQALMELGSLICTVREPKCAECPVAAWCQARRHGIVAQVPAAGEGKKYEEVTEIAVVIRRGKQIFLRQCQPGERWAGLWDFPRFALPLSLGKQKRELHIVEQTRSLTSLCIEPGELLTTLKHGVTRFRITLHCYQATLASQSGEKWPRNYAAARWVTIDSLANYALSTTGRQIARLLTR